MLHHGRGKLIAGGMRSEEEADVWGTIALIICGPIIWWMLRGTAAPRTAASAVLSSWVMRLSLLLYVVADVILVVSGVYSKANAFGAVFWVIAGVLAVWATTRWRYGLAAIVDRVSARQEAAWQADAEAGNPQAAHMLGTSLKVRGELEPARRWLQAAAEAGLADAQWDLARLINQVESAAAARPWFEAAAAGGHPGARHLLRPGGAYDTTEDAG